jgi:hypothetical protein
MNFSNLYDNFTLNLRSRSLVLSGILSLRKDALLCTLCFQLRIGECQCTHARWEHSDISS